MIRSPRMRFFDAGLLSSLLLPALVSAAAAQQTRPAQPSPANPAQPRAATQPGKSAPSDSKAAVAAKPAAAAANAASRPGGAGAVRIASFGDWEVYAAQSGRNKVCYALTQPKDRQPKALTRDPGYLFVSFRPAENVKNEIALMMGYPTKESDPAEAAIGNAKYALLTKEQNAWLRNPAEESQAITAMSRGQTVVVKAASRRGNATTDRYSLKGFAQALERARKECP